MFFGAFREVQRARVKGELDARGLATNAVAGAAGGDGAAPAAGGVAMDAEVRLLQEVLQQMQVRESALEKRRRI